MASTASCLGEAPYLPFQPTEICSLLGKHNFFSQNTLTDSIAHHPRVMADLFKGVEERKESAHARLKCAFLEIHNEEVRDLLHPETQSKSIAIRERGDGALWADDEPSEQFLHANLRASCCL